MHHTLNTLNTVINLVQHDINRLSSGSQAKKWQHFAKKCQKMTHLPKKMTKATLLRVI